MGDRISVEVVYALPDRQVLRRVELDAPARVADAVAAARLDVEFPGEPLGDCAVGIWGRVVGRDATLRDGDRVELYRPLVMDPREARRQRARGRD